MTRNFDRVFGSSVDHPWWVGLFILALSGLALLGFLAPEKVTGLIESTPRRFRETSPSPDKENAPSVPQVDPVRLNDSDVILVVESGGIFTAEGAEALRNIVTSLEKLDYVQRVFWMDRVPVLNVFGLRESLFPRAALRRGNSRRLAKRRSNIRSWAGNCFPKMAARCYCLSSWIGCSSKAMKIARFTSKKSPGKRRRLIPA